MRTSILDNILRAVSCRSPLLSLGNACGTLSHTHRRGGQLYKECDDSGERRLGHGMD